MAMSGSMTVSMRSFRLWKFHFFSWARGRKKASIGVDVEFWPDPVVNIMFCGWHVGVMVEL